MALVKSVPPWMLQTWNEWMNAAKPHSKPNIIFSLAIIFMLRCHRKHFSIRCDATSPHGMKHCRTTMVIARGWIDWLDPQTEAEWSRNDKQHTSIRFSWMGATVQLNEPSDMINIYFRPLGERSEKCWKLEGFSCALIKMSIWSLIF